MTGRLLWPGSSGVGGIDSGWSRGRKVGAIWSGGANQDQRRDLGHRGERENKVRNNRGAKSDRGRCG